MNRVTKAIIDGIDWSVAGTAVGEASSVPGALADLFDAQSEEEAKAAYWGHLDNEVVVQGQLHDAAQLVIAPILIELSSGALTTASRYRSVELLVEIALGTQGREEASPHQSLREGCTSELQRGLWTLYSLLDCSDERVVVDVIDILEVIDERRPRLIRGVSHLARSPSEVVARRVLELISNESPDDGQAKYSDGCAPTPPTCYGVAVCQVGR